LILISTLLGLKLARISTTLSPFVPRHGKAHKRTPLNFIILTLYINAMLLLFVELLFSSGITFTDSTTCTATGILDTLFFFATKVLLQLFLLERLRISRRALYDRWKDPLYVFPLSLLGVGFIVLAVVGFRWLWHVYSDGSSVGGGPGEGTCAIGFPNGVAIALLTFDVCVSIGVTGLFLWVLQDATKAFRNVSAVSTDMDMNLNTFQQQEEVFPMSEFGETGSSRSSSWKKTFVNTSINSAAAVVKEEEEEEEFGRSNTPPQIRSYGDERVIRLIKKSMIGAVITYIPFSINLAMLVSLGGLEAGWFCFVMCTLDTTCCVCVVHWLTNNVDDK